MLDSLVKAKMEVRQLKSDTATYNKEIRSLKALLAVHETNDSLRIEMAVLRARITADEDKCFGATKRIAELTAENKKLKKKWILEAASSVVVLATALYLTLK
jgi:hypothetical protein